MTPKGLQMGASDFGSAAHVLVEVLVHEGIS